MTLPKHYFTFFTLGIFAFMYIFCVLASVNYWVYFYDVTFMTYAQLLFNSVQLLSSIAYTRYFIRKASTHVIVGTQTINLLCLVAIIACYFIGNRNARYWITLIPITISGFVSALYYVCLLNIGVKLSPLMNQALNFGITTSSLLIQIVKDILYFCFVIDPDDKDYAKKLFNSSAVFFVCGAFIVVTSMLVWLLIPKNVPHAVVLTPREKLKHFNKMGNIQMSQMRQTGIVEKSVTPPPQKTPKAEKQVVQQFAQSIKQGVENKMHKNSSSSSLPEDMEAYQRRKIQRQAKTSKVIVQKQQQNEDSDMLADDFKYESTPAPGDAIQLPPPSRLEKDMPYKIFMKLLMPSVIGQICNYFVQCFVFPALFCGVPNYAGFANHQDFSDPLANIMRLTIYFVSAFVFAFLVSVNFVRRIFGYWVNNVICYLKLLFIPLYYMAALPRPMVENGVVTRLPLLHSDATTYIFDIFLGAVFQFPNILLYVNSDDRMKSQNDKQRSNSMLTMVYQSSMIIGGIASIFAAKSVE